MSSTVMKIFLLAIFFTLQSGTTGQVVVTGAPLPVDGSVPPRENIRVVEQDPIKLNCLLLGLECMQKANVNDPLSYRLIAAIHGSNLRWNNDNNGRTSNGYCPHGNVFFPTWHRPYLALFEQALLRCMKSVIEQFPLGSERDEHLRVAERARLPYWDWADPDPMPEIIGTTAASQTVTIRKMQNGILTNVSMPNPMCRYFLQPEGDSIASIGSGTVETVRYPVKPSGVYVSQPGSFASSVSGARNGWETNLKAIFEGSKTYSQFASSSGGSYSIENPHNGVHTTSGGNNGHMSSVKYAAFDALFWFHHCNVDRLFAIWQAIYPNSYLTGSNLNAPLYPFRAPNNQYWNSSTVRNTGALGYRYLEAANQETANATVKSLYKANIAGRRKRNLDTINRVNTEEDSDNLARVARARDGANGKADTCESYDEYHARITISNGAADGSSTVYLFLCEPYANENNYPTDPCFAGSMGVFSSPGMGKSHRRLYRGMVSLTEALENRYAASDLKNMTTKAVTAYLKDNLIWKIVGKQTADCDLDGFDIHVVKIKVDVPNDKYTLPYWEETTQLCKVV